LLDYSELATQWQHGDRAAGDALLSALDCELHTIAAARLRKESNSSLSTGDLVNEAIIKITQLDRMQIGGRPHILALASRMMRQILIDKARKRATAKRNFIPVTLSSDLRDEETPIELLELDRALRELEEFDPERAQIVEMRFFGGMSIPEIAEVTELSEATVKRRWIATRAWLAHRMGV
jgi:RNA polymerase sigma factor (TIGR02999 family)